VTNVSITTGGLDILFVFAHPDDESFGFAGLMAWAQASGHRVGLICATRGEVGEISDPLLGTPETLGAVRERELRDAMSIVGVDPVRLLSYRDSGMAGTTPNDDPRSLLQASRDSVIADVVYQIRDLRPRTVITFGPDGIYGHPDHIRIGDVTAEAVRIAATSDLAFLGKPWRVSRLYFAAIAREDLIEASQRLSGPFAGTPAEAIARMGTPRAEITHVFDVSPYLSTKLRVINNHATQLPQNEKGPANDIAMRPWLTRESIAIRPLPWDDATEHGDLLDAFRITQPYLLA
jgi:LmbE family N-acetylglucosaminyl deacetylase